MRVINKTVWRTDQLKAILQRCAKQEFDDGSRRKRLVITVEYTRRGGCSGYAWYHSNHSVVRIANPTRVTKWYRASGGASDFGQDFAPGSQYMTNLTMEFASVACHEFAHNRGMKHRGMPKYYGWGPTWKQYVAWAAEMPLEQKATKAPAAKSEIVQGKLDHVIKMRERAETRMKRAKTILQKWTVKERYYEKRKAAMGVRK